MPAKSRHRTAATPRRLAPACFALLLFAAPMLFSCRNVPPPSATDVADPYADISLADLQSTLAGLSRAHDQKTQLAFYAGLPTYSWKGVHPPFEDFYKNMGTEQARLLAEIQSWAKTSRLDLTYHFAPGIDGQAEKIIEARQEKLVRGDSSADFTRDTLMQMYTDYEWQISQIQALLPHVKDPALKAYLIDSLKVHQDGDAQLVSLLQRFKSPS